MTVARVMNALASAVNALADDRGVCIFQGARDWHSPTFSGARHSLTFAFDGEDAVTAGEAMLDALPGHAFAIPGHTVADIDVIRIERRADPPRLVVDCKLLLLETP